jgi:hypothetical protein
MVYSTPSPSAAGWLGSLMFWDWRLRRTRRSLAKLEDLQYYSWGLCFMDELVISICIIRWN